MYLSPDRAPGYTLCPPSSSLNEQTISPFMSHAHATVSSSPNFQLIINNALDEYKRRTKNDLITHPLAAQLQSCNSPGSILDVLQQQARGLDQSRSTINERWSRWLDPTVHVLYALSSTLGAGVGLVCLRTWTVLDLHSHIYLTGILTRECDIRRSRHSPFGLYPR
jgi:hypothetical protein